jgi:gamma-glutamyltranspeptidase
MAETMRHAYVDRNSLLGDPGVSTTNPGEALQRSAPGRRADSRHSRDANRLANMHAELPCPGTLCDEYRLGDLAAWPHFL